MTKNRNQQINDIPRIYSRGLVAGRAASRFQLLFFEDGKIDTWRCILWKETTWPQKLLQYGELQPRQEMVPASAVQPLRRLSVTRAIIIEVGSAT